MTSAEQAPRNSDNWAAAIALADELATALLEPTYRTRELPTWDHYGVRGMVAVTAYAVALSERCSVDDVRLSRVLVPLLSHVDFRAQATVLLEAGHKLDDPDSDDPVVQQWQWLLRTWDPHEPPQVRWGGMTRGLDPHRPDPAVNVLCGQARLAVQDPLVLERGGIARGSGVEITGGRYAGQVGHVAGAHFARSSNQHDLAPGPPGEYVISFGAGTVDGIALVAAEHLSDIAKS